MILRYRILKIADCSSRQKKAFFSFRKSAVILFFVIMSLILFQKSLFAEDSLISYETHFSGIKDKELLSYIKMNSDLIRLKDRPLISLRFLKKRADNDRETIIKILKSKGFFKCKAEIGIDTKPSRVSVSVTINLGPRFILKKVNIKVTGGEEQPESIIPDSFKSDISNGKPYKSTLVADTQETIILFFKKAGYPFVKMSDYEIIADHKENSVSINYTIDTGSKAVFGETTFKGLESVDQTYLLPKIMWKQGDIYNIDLVKKTHGKLTGLGLFSIVHVVEGKSPDEKGRLPVTIEVKERKQKTIGAGFFYKTDEGPGVKSMWENRNIMGKGERLTTSIEFSDFTIAAEGIFQKPDFYREDQDIKISLRIAEDEPDAYKSTYLETIALIERKLSDHMNAGGGLAYKSSTVDQQSSSENYSLFYVPMFSSWDNTDDLLDPGKGNRLSIEVTPFYDTSGHQSRFIKSYIDFRYYLSLLQNPSITLAANLTIGSIYGAASNEIPADERFYAGGGGSVRGYAYQSIGPYSDGDPYGGKSLLEISLEPRIRLSDKFGLVFFIDGGTAYSEKLLSSNEDFLWGTGAGLRYYTPIGPLRMDIGLPLNRRKSIDDSFQIYLSIGQAF